jgi:hypothetical protein
MKNGMIMLYFSAYTWSYGRLVSYALLACLCVYISLEIIMKP